jgi:small subunit ribosomal protein S14
MARLSQMVPRKEKFTHQVAGHAVSVRNRNRCPVCGRSRGFMRKFRLCRICFRNLALKGDVPGVIKSSW